MKSAFYLFLLFPLAFSTLGSLDLDGSLAPDGHADLVIIAQFNDSAGKTVFLNVSGPLEVLVRDKTGLVIEHQIVKSGNGTLIYAVVPLDYLSYEISSDSLTRKEGASWNFELTVSSSENISSLNSTVAFPKGTTLKSTNGAVSASAESLSISWKAANVAANQPARMRAGYEIVEIQDDNSGLIVVAAAAVIAILAAAWLLRPKPAKVPQTSPQPEEKTALESNSVFKTLDEIDKDIIREIVRQKGKTTQAAIYLNTHIPKATLSRRLSSLEGRGIIQKSQKGNRNLITLSDALK